MFQGNKVQSSLDLHSGCVLGNSSLWWGKKKSNPQTSCLYIKWGLVEAQIKISNFSPLSCLSGPSWHGSRDNRCVAPHRPWSSWDSPHASCPAHYVPGASLAISVTPESSKISKRYSRRDKSPPRPKTPSYRNSRAIVAYRNVSPVCNFKFCSNYVGKK